MTFPKFITGIGPIRRVGRNDEIKGRGPTVPGPAFDKSDREYVSVR